MNNLKYVIKRQKNKVGLIYRYYLNNNNQTVARYAKYYQELDIKKNSILFESRDGKSFADNPLAIYLNLLARSDFKNYQFYWTYTQDCKDDIELLPQDERVKFVRRNSDEYLQCLTSCQYLINNSTFQAFYTKKEGQIYINTWHGIPLKQMGLDMPDNSFGEKNVMRNLLMSDYFLSPNSYTTNIFRRAYKLDGLYEGKIIENGYPRVDLTTSSQFDVEPLLTKYNVKIDKTKQIILYTPTWKGSRFDNPRTSINKLIAEIKYLEQELGSNYQILCKVHPFTYKQIAETGLLNGYLIPDTMDANQLLSLVDVLVTDYSSIFFDYLVTEKPIIFYCWDKELYKEERGLYIEEQKLPGPVVETIFDVSAQIKRLDEVKSVYSHNYAIMKEKMCSLQTGQVTQRLVDKLFLGKDDVQIVTVPQKEKILIYGGALKVNGITEALMSLLSNIDKDKYDITILVNPQTNKHKEEQDYILKNINYLRRKFRVIFKFGSPIYTLKERFADLQSFRVTHEELNYPINAYKREAKRLTACCHFDVAIDYSGYSYYWAKLIAFANANKHLIINIMICMKNNIKK